MTTLKTPPTLKGHPLLGKLKEFQANPITVLQEAQDTGAPLVKLRIGPMTAYYITSVEGTLQAMQKNASNYIKGGFAVNTAKRLMGNGLVFSEGEFWRRQRRIANPAFHKGCLENYAQIMVNANLDMIDEVKASPGPVDVTQNYYHMAINIVRNALFGAETSAEYLQTMIDHIELVIGESQRRTNMGLNPPLWAPMLGNKKIRESMKTSEEIIVSIIEEKKTQETPGNTLIDMLMHTPDPETGQSMEYRALIDEVNVFFLAGTETSAHALTWMTYLLGTHPHIQERCRQEVQHVLGNRRPEFDDMAKLPYLQLAIQETLRMYPPAWFTMRQTVNDDDIGGYKLPAGSSVFMSEYMMHHHPSAWKNPKEFNPERFTEEQAQENNTKAYMPFTVGPRKCLGWRFALTEMTMAMCGLLRTFTWTPVNNTPPEKEFNNTLNPKGGMPVDFKLLEPASVSA